MGASIGHNPPPQPLDKCVIEIRSIQLNNFQASLARYSFMKNSLANKYHRL